MINKLDWNLLSENRKNVNPLPIIFNWFIERFNYISYLELGLRKGETFNDVKCEFKESVDSNTKTDATYKMTTDEFFEKQSNDRFWDIIFVDADHNKKSVLKDIKNSLKHLNRDGIIFAHDVNPLSERHLEKRFCYNAWESFVHLRQTCKDLSMYVLPFGMLGIIQFGHQQLWKKKVEWTWKYLDKNRKLLLRQLTEKDF